ncbi:polysaccharide lyase family 7 protein [Tianweitania sediminis]|uniref:Polysaccharide lyase family 7 protein n=1 Tax=Tianweitania sediminis TaxID=1502156 RepID=A0A8J7UIV0_9HYPH|nr:polysaccharide lyase family 7 protein [Tianweitania sediminis]MBP0440629.1 polysaccharide lyase family 7 protein [Tianweitania sediminis]
MVTNSDRFDLSNWKLTLPTDAKGGSSGTAVEVKNLFGYENSSHFFDADDGAMVFRAHVGGATTSGSKYARSELREMNGTERAAWTLKEGGTMTATLRIENAPSVDGEAGRVIVGQIHGDDHELVRLYWENGEIYFKNDRAGSGDKELRFDLRNHEGAQPNVSLGESFSYKIDARGDRLIVEIFADGQVYSSETSINKVWQEDTFYFKAGAYLGVNDTQGSGTAQVAFTGLDFSHAVDGGLGGWKADALPTSPGNGHPLPEVPGPHMPVPSLPSKGDGESDAPGQTLSGTARNETLAGSGGDDTIRGQGGDDVLNGASGGDILWGNGGRDILRGGAGDDWLKGGDSKDTYVFETNHGHDTLAEFRKGEALIFEAGLFESVSDAKGALHQTDDGIVLVTGSDSSILFTDTSFDHLNGADWILHG